MLQAYFDPEVLCVDGETRPRVVIVSTSGRVLASSKANERSLLKDLLGCYFQYSQKSLPRHGNIRKAFLSRWNNLRIRWEIHKLPMALLHLKLNLRFKHSSNSVATSRIQLTNHCGFSNFFRCMCGRCGRSTL